MYNLKFKNNMVDVRRFIDSDSNSEDMHLNHI